MALGPSCIGDVALNPLLGSFVPPAPIQALRELTRTRKQLGREVTAHSQRIEKVLESADVRLATVLHPLVGVSGRAIVAALAAGETDPDRLVALAHPRLRAKRDALRAAVPGHVRPHHRVLLRQHLRVVETLQATIAELDATIGVPTHRCTRAGAVMGHRPCSREIGSAGPRCPLRLAAGA
jgi:transposase